MENMLNDFTTLYMIYFITTVVVIGVTATIVTAIHALTSFFTYTR